MFFFLMPKHSIALNVCISLLQTSLLFHSRTYLPHFFFSCLISTIKKASSLLCKHTYKPYKKVHIEQHFNKTLLLWILPVSSEVWLVWTPRCRINFPLAWWNCQCFRFSPQCGPKEMHSGSQHWVPKWYLKIRSYERVAYQCL